MAVDFGHIAHEAYNVFLNAGGIVFAASIIGAVAEAHPKNTALFFLRRVVDLVALNWGGNRNTPPKV